MLVFKGNLHFLKFVFFILNYYFSDENIKNSYRSTKIFDNKIVKYSKTLQSLESDTGNIVEYVENTFNKDKKKYKFWELIINNDK